MNDLVADIELSSLGNGRSKILVRIDRGVVDANLVMKMWARGTSAGTDIPDELSATDGLSGGHCERRKMTVAGLNTVPVLDLDKPSVAAHEVGKRDHAIRWCNNCMSVPGGYVYATVERTFTVERIH